MIEQLSILSIYHSILYSKSPVTHRSWESSDKTVWWWSL